MRLCRVSRACGTCSSDDSRLSRVILTNPLSYPVTVRIFQICPFAARFNRVALELHVAVGIPTPVLYTESGSDVRDRVSVPWLLFNTYLPNGTLFIIACWWVELVLGLPLHCAHDKL